MQDNLDNSYVILLNDAEAIRREFINLINLDKI